jgi:predicted NAD/FAD-dependent oxidoreductase
MYDIIVIGGGIAGVYTTYKIHKKNPKVKVLLIEKENRLGGRVHTVTNNYMSVEAGAGRINGSHPHTMDLIRELGLSKKLRKIQGSVVFRPANFQGEVESSVSDAPHTEQPIIDNLVDIALGPKTLPNASLILNLVLTSKTYSKQYLQNHTLSQFAQRVLTKEQVEFIKRSFGYYSELVIMNAYDAIKLLNALGPNNTFYGLDGGLEQIIDKMVNVIKKNSNITIILHKEVSKINYREPDNIFDVYINQNKYECQTCICAVPKNALKKWNIFKDIRTLLDKVECGTLCRIYSKFDKDPTTNSVWFKDMDKFTTDNDLRMVIPINTKEGIVMISYSDNIFADQWQKLYEKKGIRAVNTKLREDILESVGKWIPVPKHTQVFYWDCGVGYWTVGADSHQVAKKIINPFCKIPLYVCGENYSENGQQWIEGGLETADKILQRLL